MSRTSRADRNWLSWSGDTLQLYLGTDHPEDCPRVPAEAIPPDPAEWDSACKVSGNTYPLYLRHIVMAQCRENALDINHAHDVNIGAVFGCPGQSGEQVITVKGGSERITLAGPIVSAGTNADIVLGQWADQSTAPSHDIDLSGLYTPDGTPITVILARVDRKSVKLPLGARVLFWKSSAFTVYWHLKRAAVALHLI